MDDFINTFWLHLTFSTGTFNDRSWKYLCFSIRLEPWLEKLVLDVNTEQAWLKGPNLSGPICSIVKAHRVTFKYFNLSCVQKQKSFWCLFQEPLLLSAWNSAHVELGGKTPLGCFTMLCREKVQAEARTTDTWWLDLKFSTAQIHIPIPNRKSFKIYENLSFFQKKKSL